MKGRLQRQNVYKTQLEQIISNYKKTSKSRRTPGYILGKIESVKSIANKFNDNHSELGAVELISIEDPKIQSAVALYLKGDQFRDFEETYSEFLGDLQDALSACTPQSTTTSVQNTHIQEQSGSLKALVKLPTLEIPKFDGQYTSWRTFHDRYVSLIHNEDRLMPVDKLHYLKSSLTGEARRDLDSFDMTSENYDAAWELLCKRYNKRRLLVYAQLKLLFNHNMIKSESHKEIRTLLDELHRIRHALQVLKVTIMDWDPIFVYVTAQRLPDKTRNLWEQLIAKSDELPSLEELTTFLEERHRSLEAIKDVNVNKCSKEGLKAEKMRQRTTSYHIYQQDIDSREERQLGDGRRGQGIQCAKCKKEHFLSQCDAFKSLSIPARRRWIAKKRLCFNCFQYHHSRHCSSNNKCPRCHKRHHLLLHLNEGRKPEGSDQQTTASKQINEPAVTNCNYNSHTTQSMLATAQVKVKDRHGNCLALRALIDPGSQSSFITESAFQSLKPEVIPTSLRIKGLASAQVATSNKLARFTLVSTVKNKYESNIQAYVIKDIASTFPPRRIKQREWSFLEGLELADPRFMEQGRIDLLLGVNVYADILSNGLRKGPKGTIVLQQTSLGWILFGKLPTDPEHGKNVSFSAFTTQKDTLAELHEQVRKFWEQEEMPTARMLTSEEEPCERFYDETTKRQLNGQYMVRLPFKDGNPPVLGDSRRQALSRFTQLETKLAQRPELREPYHQCLQEYLDLGHMTSTGPEECQRYYLPHHAVLKESTTTKVRVVFDASASSSNGKSLNQQMLTGPTLQPKLFSTLLNWRKYRYAMTADIEKMYRMILVHPSDRQYQTIIWRKHQAAQLKEYELRTVTFGTTSVPYLAIKTLQRLAGDDRQRYPKAAEVTYSDFYVDDVLTGADTLEDAKELQGQLIGLLKGGGFHLRKWAANHQDLLKSIPREDREVQLPLQVNDDNMIKALGIYWHPADDFFSYAIKPEEFQKQANTKREILSEVAKLFDPLGWIAPCIILAKLIMQKLWMSGCKWDDVIDKEIRQEWIQFRDQLPNIQDIRLPRWVHTERGNQDRQLLGFCDASTRAYAAVVYMRSADQEGNITITLLMAKTRVAPIKLMSLPRLELCGAVLLSRLIKQAKEDMNLGNIYSRCWTDSKVVLAWLKGIPRRWKTFVANRTVEIHENTPNTVWQYVPTKENPADIASRGIMPGKLKDATTWWHGPSWLQEVEDKWPKEPPNEFTTELESKTTTKVMVTMPPEEVEWWMKFSSFTKTLRVMAYCCRFIHNSRNKQQRRMSQILAEEIEDAKSRLVRLAQQTMFTDEYKQLANANVISKQSQLIKLNPFISKDGTLRVGGRLQNSNLPYNQKHPMILQRRHHLTNIIIDHHHKKTIHGGAHLVLTNLRNQFWILNGLAAVKERIYKCVKCTRYRAAAPQQIMGELPSARVTKTNIFENVGIDFAGPCDLKMSKHKGSKVYKGYFCIFVCMATKAIHIEVASDMSTDAFIAALRRFIGRRGQCRNIYSDNGTNFVGANKQLQAQLRRAIGSAATEAAAELANDGIQWHFNPPSAPHHGGLWEAGIKRIKYHLKRATDENILTFEELSTLLIQIESCLNSRPLCTLSADPSNLEILTPGHFLIGRHLKTIPEPEGTEADIKYTDRWKQVQQILQRFWKQWSSEYLIQLQQRAKWHTKQPNMKVGQVVIIMDNNRPPNQWPLGLITETHPGIDGHVRVVTIKTSTTTSKRPINKLCPLSA